MNLKLDGISTSEHIDSSGELLIIENHDISDLVEGKGVLNFEHSNKAEDIVGAVIYAKKIMKKEDCENDRQRQYWEFSKKPFVYIIGELWEDEEHPGACAVAAMVRYYNKKSEKILVGFSIEGATLERDDYILKESVGRRVAITLRSCNKMAIAGVLDDPREKSVAKSIKKMEHSLAKSFGIESCILEDMFMPKDPILDLHKAVESFSCKDDGSWHVQCGTFAADRTEQLSPANISAVSDRNRVKAAVRDWDRKRPLKEVLKATLPEVSDDYIGHFEKLAEELALKKNMPTNKLVRIGAPHAHPQSDDEQKGLVEGIYHDPSAKFDPGLSSYRGLGNSLTKGKNDAGQDVIMKFKHSVPDALTVDPKHIGRKYENAHNHFQIMKDVFGLRDHVPVSAHVTHPQINGGNPINVQEFVKGSKTAYEGGEPMARAIRQNSKDGHMHKIVLANHILGVADRHNGNVLIHPNGHFMSIDHDDAFRGWSGGVEPDLIYQEHGNEPLHPKAAAWIKSIDPRQLAGKMLDQGHDPSTIKTAVSGLKYYQRLADRPGMTIGQMFDHAANHMTVVRNEQPKVA